MNADQVRAYVSAQWPKALQSPLAHAMVGASAMALLESSDADVAIRRAEAMEAARACLRACGGWTVETLSTNVESAMGGEMDADECDEVAREAIEGESAKRKTFSERVARLNSDPAHRANVAAEKEAADRDIRDAIARRA